MGKQPSVPELCYPRQPGAMLRLAQNPHSRTVGGNLGGALHHRGGGIADTYHRRRLPGRRPRPTMRSVAICLASTSISV